MGKFLRRSLLVLAFVLSAILFGGLFFLVGTWAIQLSNFIRPKDVIFVYIGLPFVGAVVGVYVCAVVLDFLEIDSYW